VSGGFAVVQPGSQLSINAVEGFPIEDFSAEVSIATRCAQTPRLTVDRLCGTRSLRLRRLSAATAASRTLLRLRSSSRYASISAVRSGAFEALTILQVLESLQAALK